MYGNFQGQRDRVFGLSRSCWLPNGAVSCEFERRRGPAREWEGRNEEGDGMGKERGALGNDMKLERRKIGF